MRQTILFYSIFSQFVTIQILYTESMNNILFFPADIILANLSPTTNTNNLLSVGTIGFIWLLILFLFSFVFIHIIKLAQIGWKYQERTSPTKPENPPNEKREEKENKALADTPQEPIYYIVERKTKRAKPSYGEPKQIRFK